LNLPQIIKNLIKVTEKVHQIQRSALQKLLHITCILWLGGMGVLTPLAHASAQQPTKTPVVHLMLFWMEGCPHCEEVLKETISPLQKEYGERLAVTFIEVSTTQDVSRLYAIGEEKGIPKSEIGVPLVVIGDHILIGSEQIPKELPDLIDVYLANGGVELPDDPNLQSLPTSIPADMTTAKKQSGESDIFTTSVDGFWLGIAAMLLMASALNYAIFALITTKTLRGVSSPTSRNVLFWLLILFGLGIAAYLTYVETKHVSAFCGPVGDCNQVQSSPYAQLFGVLPVGLLGIIAYLALGIGWFISRQKWGNISRYFAPLGVFAIAFFGVIFSLYLTYLELFIIQAVCSWCIGSAIVITFLLILSLEPASSALKSPNQSKI